MSYIVAGIYAVLCSLIAYVTIDKDVSERISLLHKTSLENISVKKLNKKIIFITVLVIFVVSLSTAIKILIDISEVINICKMLISFWVLIGSACFDYREHRIPNIFSIILCVMAIVLLTIGYISGQEGAISYVISSVFAAAGCAVGLTVAAFLSKGGIGAGDVKLLSALALIGGVPLICSVLFFSIFCSAIVAFVFLITKQKTLQAALPFGPFILVGFIISIFTSMY